MNPNSKKLDLNKLSDLRRLRTIGGSDFVENVAVLFEQSTLEGLSFLREAIAIKNSKALLETAHYLKTNSTTVGAHYMAALFLEIESLGKTGQFDNKMRVLIDSLEKELKNTLSELKSSHPG